MNIASIAIGFLVLGSALGLALKDDTPPIFRFSYELVNFRGYGKPGRAY
jgi:hypothetical protein